MKTKQKTEKTKIKRYPETHQQGIISIEKGLPQRLIAGDLGIMIAENGKVWICINGESIIRFRPYLNEEERIRCESKYS